MITFTPGVTLDYHRQRRPFFRDPVHLQVVFHGKSSFRVNRDLIYRGALRHAGKRKGRLQEYFSITFHNNGVNGERLLTSVQSFPGPKVGKLTLRIVSQITYL